MQTTAARAIAKPVRTATTTTKLAPTMVVTVSRASAPATTATKI